MNDPVLDALKDRFADGSRLIPGTQTVQSPAASEHDEDDQPTEADEALRQAKEHLSQANGSGSPASLAKAQRALEAATVAVIQSRHAHSRRTR